MKRQAELEGNQEAIREAAHQIAESQTHAEEFREMLAKAEKKFAALAKIEKRHAEAYQQKLEAL